MVPMRSHIATRLWAITLAVSTQLTSLVGEQLEHAIPEDIGFSSAALRAIEGAVGEHLDQGHLAGAVTLVLKQGKIAHLEAHGWQDLEKRIPMAEDSIFRIYSMTKPIVSTGVMILEEEGLIDLDDPIGDYIPELAELRVHAPDGLVSAEQPVSVRDLLRHTAGMTYGFFGNTAVDVKYRELGVLNPTDDATAFVNKLARLPLLFQPGKGWNYSVSVDVQGVLIERVSGVSLDRFLQERIFEPLEMSDTGFHVPIEKRHRFTTHYNTSNPSKIEVADSPLTSNYRFPPKFYSGGGGLVSTAKDYAHFVQMLINKGELFGNRILSKQSVAEMTRNQLPTEAYPIGIGESRPGVGFGLGFSVREESSAWDPDGRVGEYGWGGAASTHFWISPKDKLGVITLEQSSPYNWNLEFGLKGIVYDAIQN